MTKLPQDTKQSNKGSGMRFEWGNFLQGGLVLYLLGGGLIYEGLKLKQTGGGVFAIFAIAIILWLMATGLTFFGDLGAALMLFQVPRGKKFRKPMSTVTVSSNRFMANERVKLMSKELRRALLDLLARDMKMEAIEHYRQETKTDPRLAADVITQLQDFKRRGLPDDLD